MNINKLIDKYLPAAEKEFISILSAFDDQIYEIYLVGGAIRDILLGISPNEIDIALKGNFNSFLKDLDKNSKVEIIQVTEFGTSKINFNGKLIDIANTRTEAYIPKGSLPKINQLSVDIENDLQRRDFTINSLAYCINNSNNNLIDPNNGLSDIKHRLIRNIHIESFSDDPTRIFRAIKYSLRLDFNIESKTLSELKSKLNLINNLSKYRILNEIKKTLDEKNPEKIINKLIQLNIFRYFFDISKVNINFNKSPKDITNYEYLILYFTYKDEDKLPYYLNNFDNSKSLAKKVDHLKNINHVVRYIFKNDFINLPPELYIKIHKIPKQLFNVFKSFNKDDKIISDLISKLTNSKPFLNFNDIKNLGFKDAKEISNLLLKLEIARFNNQLFTVKDEENFIKKLFN
ncbi:MAG: CCA tRNA nucleotidyltransferase [Dehalococcoidia bacterium]